MEKQTRSNEVSTKANDEKKNIGAERGVLLSARDAEEFRVYKRRKKMAEVSSAIARSGAALSGGEDVQRVCERATRLRQAAIKLPVTKLSQAKYYLSGSGVKLDCAVGGNGETLAKVKAYEARLAVRRGAGEITVPVSPSLLDCCRYSEIRKELKRVRRAAGKAGVKVRVEKTNSPTTLSRVARIACEIGAKYFSVPYFKDCERLRMDLTHGCQLEVSGVETAEDFQKLTEAGVGRIVTDHAWEIYTQWMKEACETPFVATPVAEEKQPQTEANEAQTEEKQTPSETAQPQETTIAAKPLNSVLETNGKNPETEYCCRLEGNDLKFL